MFPGTELVTCDDPDVTMVIDLSGLKPQQPGIFGDDVAELPRCTGVTALDLSGNHARNAEFDHLDFSTFPQLAFLDLSRNRLDALPPGLIDHPTLRALSLSRSSIEFHDGLIDEWNTPKLEYLDIRLTPMPGAKLMARLRAANPNLVIHGAPSDA